MCPWVSFPSWKPATTHTARRTRPACGRYDIFDCGPLGDAEKRKGSGTAKWNDGMDTDRSARRVRHPTPGRRPTCAFEARRTDVPSTSNTASKPFESVANDVNKPCLGPCERGDPAADARRMIEIDGELSQPPVER